MTQMTNFSFFPQTSPREENLKSSGGKAPVGHFGHTAERNKLFDRAARYVDRMPAAISGQGGHPATFRAAIALVHGFALDAHEAWPLLCAYNARCQPPWSERELRHKLTSASQLRSHQKPLGHLRASRSGGGGRGARESAWCPEFDTAPAPQPAPRSRPANPDPTSRPVRNFYRDRPAAGEVPEVQAPAAAPEVLVPAGAAIEPAGDAEFAAEATRIAHELRKIEADHPGLLLDERGELKPGAEIYAGVLRLFRGTYVPRPPFSPSSQRPPLLARLGWRAW